MKRQIHIFVRLNIDLRCSARAMAVSYLNNNMAKSVANEWNAHSARDTLNLIDSSSISGGGRQQQHYKHTTTILIDEKKQCFYDVKERKLQ